MLSDDFPTTYVKVKKKNHDEDFPSILLVPLGEYYGQCD
jgi:hypothetical protein